MRLWRSKKGECEWDQVEKMPKTSRVVFQMKDGARNWYYQIVRIIRHTHELELVTLSGQHIFLDSFSYVSYWYDDELEHVEADY